MSQLTSPGLKLRPTTSAHLRLGSDELQWSQYESQEQRATELLGMLQRTGLLIDRDSAGQLRDDWKVAEDPDNAGYLVIGTSDVGVQSCVDDEGYVVTIDGQYRPYTLEPARALALSVPNDSTWRTLVVRRAMTAYEPGTLAFSNGDATVTGTGTKFTRYTGRNETSGTGQVHGTYIRIDSSDQATLGAANPSGEGAGRYEIASVTSDTELELRSNATATASGVPFSIAGSYSGTAPSMANRDCHLRRAPEFELVTRTRLPAAGDVVLADVQRAAGVLSIIDRRDNSLAYWKDTTLVVAEDPHPMVQFESSAAFAIDATGINISGVNGLAVAECGNAASIPAYGSSLLIAYSTATTVKTVIYSPRTGVFGSAVTVDGATTASTGVAILRIKGAGTSYKHLCIFDDSDVVYGSTSTDDGSTWGTPFVIWDVTGLAGPPTLATPVAIILRSDRIVVGASITSGGSTLFKCVVSDDYGSTWSTNSNAGWTLGGGVVNISPTVVQDPITGWIWKVAETTSNEFAVTLIPDETATASVGSGYTGSFADSRLSGGVYGPAAILLNARMGASVFHMGDAGSNVEWICTSKLVYSPVLEAVRHTYTQKTYKAHGSGTSGKIRPCAVRVEGGNAFMPFLSYSGTHFEIKVMALR